MKRISVYTEDNLLRRTLGSRDSKLDAVTLQKIVALGRRWTGDLGSELDQSVRGMMGELDTAFCIGNILHAEQLGKDVQQGKSWLGRLSQAAKSGDQSATARVLREADDDMAALHPVEHERSK